MIQQSRFIHHPSSIIHHPPGGLNMRCIVAIVLIALGMSAPVRGDQPWVAPGPDGKLIHRTDEQGNRIPDFSYCGFAGGGVALPAVAAAVTVDPVEGDMTATIQAALDQVAALPLNEAGFRGAVLLKRGTFRVQGALTIKASGVVLRGEGRGQDGSILLAAGTDKRTVLNILGGDKRQWNVKQGAAVTDDHVPVGALSFHVDHPDRLAVGQEVLIIRPSTPAWMSDIGMDRIPPHRDGRAISQWKPGDFDLRFDRTIAAIEGHRVTLDAPLGCALESRYGGAVVVPYRFEGRIENIGVENLRSVSTYAPGGETTDENHAWTFIEIDKARNVFVRDVTTLHYGLGLVNVRRDVKGVTVQDCACLDPVSQIAGSRRYSFNVAGQLVLVQRCLSRQARHDYAVDSRVPGPNAFVACVAQQSHSDIGPHHRWSTATLFDTIDAPDCQVNLQNRLCLGSGHGWSGANSVLWNCIVKQYAVQNPPGAYNWAIGVIGPQVPGDFAGQGYGKLIAPDYLNTHPSPDPAWRLDDMGTVQSPNQHVQPDSLYRAQLRDRLGPDALTNTGW
jgi:hypothetical protein